MEHKVKEYVTGDTHRLEDYSNIEICCEADREDALRLMDERVENSTYEELKAFCEAINKGTVDYMTHGCR